MPMTSPASLSTIKPSDLPAPPQSALEMLRACSRSDVDNRQLAGFARTDPVLTAEVLRVVNTPLFGIGREVNSVQHAITLLGVRALRNIVLCLLVREAVTQQTIPGVDITRFWEDSLRRAVAARLIGPQFGLDADDCFSAGLLQDFGLLILFYLQPQFAGHFAEFRELDPAQRLARELALFGHTHEQILAVLAQQWSLPAALSAAIASHHGGQGGGKLARVLHAADWINALFCVRDVNALLDKVRSMLVCEFQLTGQEIDTLLGELPAQVHSAAHSLGLDITQQADFEQLLRQANSRLAKENMSYQELTWQLEKAIAERDRLAQELNREIAIAREVQQRLMPDRTPADYPLQGINLPARNISGDFFDYFAQPDGSIWFALGDVSGKGINAGLLMAKTASLFHCLAKHLSDPAQLLGIINNEICENSVRGFFVTMIAGIFHPTSRQVQLVNAGHLPALVIRHDGEVLRLPAAEPPLGIVADTRYRLSAPVALNDASLYLYTDGVTEAPLAEGQMLQEDGLIYLLQRHQALAPVQRLQAIVQAIEPAGGARASLHDDITLLLIDGRY